ncbi:MAG: PAS domain S-box protein, partial [Planctomycetes bacterium]|nr:PAS domain S-box protein [Planctomycetota bacterium]
MMKRKESYSQQAEKNLPRQNDALAAAHIGAEIERRSYQDLFNFAPDGYLVTDERGIIREANQTAAVMLGVNRELLAGKPMTVYLGEKDRKGFLDRLRHPKKYADQKGWEIDLAPQHASPFPATVNFVPIFDPLEKITGLCWLIHDISERKQVENALRASEAKWRSLVKNAPFIVTVVDRAGYIQFINRASYHPAVEDLIGTLVDNYLPPAEQERFHSILTRVFESRISEKYESANTRPDGSIIWYDNNVGPVIQDDQVVAAIWISRDVTVRKLGEEALHFSEKRFRSLAAMAPVTISLSDEKGNCQYVNQRWCQMAGLTFEEALGQGWVNGLHPDDRQHVADAWYHMAHSDGTWGLDYRFQTPQGKITWVSGYASALRDDLGHIAGYIGINMDITERKLVEEKLHASELKYRIVADNPYDWEFWSDPEDRLIYTSPSCFQITGLTAEELTRDPNLLFIIVHPEDKMLYANHSRDFHQKKMEPDYLEFRIIRPDGSERWIEHVCTPVFDGEGRYLGRRGSNRDATERKLAEEILYLVLESGNRSQRLLMALNQAAQTIQRARTPQEVFRRIGEELVRLGYQTCIFTLTEGQKNLVLASVTISSDELKEIFLQTGLIPGLSLIPIIPGGFFQHALAQRKGTHNTPGVEVIREVLPSFSTDQLEQLAA